MRLLGALVALFPSDRGVEMPHLLGEARGAPLLAPSPSLMPLLDRSAACAVTHRCERASVALGVVSALSVSQGARVRMAEPAASGDRSVVTSISGEGRVHSEKQKSARFGGLCHFLCQSI